MIPKADTKPVHSIKGVRLAGTSPGSLWDINIRHPSSVESSARRRIASITPHTVEPHTQDPSCFPLVLPSLTHPHIHLDKAFVHSTPQYSGLLPSTGSFQEALSLTTQAKAQFTLPDLLKRGGWLIAESVASGVTAMRAFVEVDSTVELNCLEAGIKLKEEWKDACHIQLACFAQDPIFSGPHGDENRRLMEEAIRHTETDVIGTTPYVESSVEAAKRNIEWAIDRCLELGRHLDLHLDYNLDGSKEPLVWHVLRTFREKGWTSRSNSSSKKKVMLGHCTRLTLFSNEEWSRLAREINENDLPVTFVGLPTSDIYMAYQPHVHAHVQPPRGTLQVPDMIRRHGLDAVMGVNNVGNAFTPWGGSDPLSLACFGVGVYQTGTQADAELLYECVSTRARAAIGLDTPRPGLRLKEGDSPDLLLLYNFDETGLGAPRMRNSVAEVVWDPPARCSRDIVTDGRLVVKPMAVEREKSSPGTTIFYAE